MSQEKQVFSKPALTLEQQLQLLLQRGLVVEDLDSLVKSLQYIGYYRLSGYLKALSPGSSATPFPPHTSFAQVLAVYNFDRELRLLIMDAIERIEVALKAALSNTMSLKYGPHWYLDSQLFTVSFAHMDFIQRIKKETGQNSRLSSGQKKQEKMFQHYYQTYQHPELPPSWMIMESLALGTVSLIFERLATADDQKAIAKSFGARPWLLRSWLHALTHLRNICAHHSRLYQRHFKMTPMALKKYRQHFQDNQTLYTQLLIINLLLEKISDRQEWIQKLLALFQKYPALDLSHLGIPPKYLSDPLWSSP